MEDREQVRLQVEERRLQAIAGLEQLTQGFFELTKLRAQVEEAGLPPLNPWFLAAAADLVGAARLGQLLPLPRDAFEVWSFPVPVDDSGDAD